MASRMRSRWTRSLTALVAGAGASPALAASLGAHALLAAAVTLVPAPPAAPATHEVEAALELVPQLLPAELLPAEPLPPAVPGERSSEPRADALDREGPPLQKIARPRNVARPSSAAAAVPSSVVPSTVVPVPLAMAAPALPRAPAPTMRVNDTAVPRSIGVPRSEPPRSTAALREAVYGEGDVDRAPRLLAAPRPPYPAPALRQGREGDVVLTLVVDAAGSVREASVTRAAGRGFDEAALAAARGLRFHPGSKAGRNVPVRVTWTCRFRLE